MRYRERIARVEKREEILTAKAPRTQSKKIRLCGVVSVKLLRVSQRHTAKPELAYLLEI